MIESGRRKTQLMAKITLKNDKQETVIGVRWAHAEGVPWAHAEGVPC